MSRIEFLPLNYLFAALSLMRIYEPIIKLFIILYTYTLVQEIQWHDFINIICHQPPMPAYHYVYFNQIFIDPYHCDPYSSKTTKNSLRFQSLNPGVEVSKVEMMRKFLYEFVRSGISIL